MWICRARLKALTHQIVFTRNVRDIPEMLNLLKKNTKITFICYGFDGYIHIAMIILFSCNVNIHKLV